VTPLHYRTATELVGALARRELSAAELLDHFAARLERVNPRVNAVVATNLEAARERAAAADRALARGEARGALHGLPMTVKDVLELVGMPTTCGAPELAKHFAERNADSVQRLLDAGAVLFGKTNTPIWAGDLQTYNEVYGTTSNPFDPARIAGGSSGGSAAALAAGLTPLELGSDIGGSIRNPAHFCGVYGHRPTYGIVPARGHIPGPPGTLAPTDLNVVGPLARAPEDLELALGVLAGPRPEDAAAWRLELPPPRRARLREFGVAAWLADPAGPPIAAEVAELLAGAVERIAAAGARVDARLRPAFDPAESHSTYLRLLYGVIGAGFPPELIRGLEQALPGLAPDDHGVFAELVRGSVGTHRQWLADDEARWRLRARWAELFREVDVLLCPIMPLAAFPHDHSPIETRSVDVDGRAVPYFDLVFWAGLFVVAGLPATVVPVGRTRAGLPVGMQVVAAHLEDRTALGFAKHLEGLLGGFAPPPALWN
jgi:amidase